MGSVSPTTGVRAARPPLPSRSRTRWAGQGSHNPRAAPLPSGIPQAAGEQRLPVEEDLLEAQAQLGDSCTTS